MWHQVTEIKTLSLKKGRKLGIEKAWLLLNFRIFPVAHLAVQYARKIDKDAHMPIHKGLSIVSSTLPLCRSLFGTAGTEDFSTGYIKVMFF